MRSQSLAFKSLCGSLWSSVRAWTLGSFLSPFSPSALLSSAFLNTQTFFFFFLIIVASVECVAVLSSGGFELMTSVPL